MRNRFVRTLVWTSLAVFVCGCGSSDSATGAPVCAAGQQIACACPGGGDGAQRCADDGSGYGACQSCPDQDSGSGGSSGADGGLDATGGGADGSEDVSADVGEATASDSSPDGLAPEADAPPACPLGYVDITSAIAQDGYYDGTTSGVGTDEGWCGGGGSPNAPEHYLRYHVDEPSALSILLEASPGTPQIDGVLYVRTTCDDRQTELVCNDNATYNAAPTLVSVPAGDIYIVVDGYDGTSGKYRLAIGSEPACETDADCTNDPGGPACNTKAGQCQPCVHDFDCVDASAPSCWTDTDPPHCGGFGGMCTDLADDGPAAARVLVLGGPALSSMSCYSDRDWYRFDVSSGATVTVKATWTKSSADQIVYVRVVDGEGRLLGWAGKGWGDDRVTISRLPPGTLYAYVTSGGPYTNVSYQISATQDSASSCASSAECFNLHEGEALRPVCEPVSSTCRFVDGHRAVTLGGFCTLDDDCASGYCTHEEFTSDPATRSYCTQRCADNAGCGFGQICDYWQWYPDPVRVCMDACSGDDQCPLTMVATASPSASWEHTQCDTNTGVCQ